ncbi:MAG TPA: hypothetical protein VHF65_03420 [Nitrososphaera sp.]|nr:hypothetical protein [Nitrososphaera sp.]
MSFFRKYLKDLDSVKKEVLRITAKQKIGSPYDLSPFRVSIEELLDSISKFNSDWNKLPVVFRIARIGKRGSTEQYGFQGNRDSVAKIDIITYEENIVLPDTKHDLELVMKMLNYMREQKGLKRTNMPLFIHPDEILNADRERNITCSSSKIQSQMAIVFHKGSVTHIGFVFERNYVILDN